jgi:hypothetical protein
MVAAAFLKSTVKDNALFLCGTLHSSLRFIGNQALSDTFCELEAH